MDQNRGSGPNIISKNDIEAPINVVEDNLEEIRMSEVSQPINHGTKIENVSDQNYIYPYKETV